MNNCTKTIVILTGLLATLISSTLLAKDYTSLSDQEIDSRLRYLDTSFADIEDPYKYWKYGWTAIYAGSGAMQIYNAIDEDNSDDATKEWVGGVKSVGGLALMLLKPVPMVAGMDDYKKMPENSRQEKLSRLTKAETMLKQTAWRANDRYTFKPHAMTVGINIIGAAAIAAFGDSSDALGSAALGIAIGEAAIWTQPTAAESKLNDYSEHFGDSKKSSVSWKIQPLYNGAELIVQF